MTQSAEQQPVAVPETAKRAGEILRRWCWVEPMAWTERMLTALDEGVKAGQWFGLIDKVHTERTLRAAFHQVASNQGAAGVNHVTIAMYQDCLDENLTNLDEELRKGTYRPQPIRRRQPWRGGPTRIAKIPNDSKYLTSQIWLDIQSHGHATHTRSARSLKIFLDSSQRPLSISVW